MAYEDVSTCSLSAAAKALARSGRTTQLGVLLKRHPWTARQLSELLQQVPVALLAEHIYRLACDSHRLPVGPERIVITRV